MTDIHLQPLFTTTIRLPDAVSSVAIGAPTLFSAEHSDQEPKLVYVKPSTAKASESNLVITMENGETISLRLLSDGASALHAPVDFLVNYKLQASFLSAQRTVRQPDPNRVRRRKLTHSTRLSTVNPALPLLRGKQGQRCRRRVHRSKSRNP